MAAGRNLTLRHLRCFFEVAETGSFTLAASRLCVTQSALTATIQQFEASVGLKLFDRNTRQVTMTPEAVQFKAYAARIIKQFDTAISDLEASAKGEHGSIRIAGSPSVVHSFLAGAIADFQSRYPGISFQLRDNNAQQVERLVAEGELDFAIAEKFQDVSELNYVPLLEDSFVLVFRNDHPLGQSVEPVKWSDLNWEGFVSFTKDTGIGHTINGSYTKWSGRERSSFEVSSTTTLIPVLNQGGCFSIVPALATQVMRFESLAFRKLIEPVITRRTYLITRKSRSLSPSSERLLAAITTSFGRHTLPEGAHVITDSVNRDPR